MMFVVKRKRFGQSRRSSVEKSLTGITALLALKSAKRGTTVQLGRLRIRLITKKGSKS